MPGKQETEPTRQVVLQRVRNGIIDYFELTSSFDDQREYQSRVPAVHIPHEIINQWEDWVSGPLDPALVEPVFSTSERSAIGRFHAVWDDVVKGTPNPLPRLDDLFVTVEWQRLRDAAFAALQVFLVRGKLSENEDYKGL